MDSLLLMPIQRVPRYELILKELVKRTSKVRLHEVYNFVQIFLLLVTKTQPFHNITPLLLTKCQAGMFRVLHPHYRLYIIILYLFYLYFLYRYCRSFFISVYFNFDWFPFFFPDPGCSKHGYR